MRIETKVINALLHAAAKKDIRVQFNGVHFCPIKGGVAAVATDGHILLAVMVPQDAGDVPDRAFTVPRARLEKLPKRGYVNIVLYQHNDLDKSDEVFGRVVSVQFDGTEHKGAEIDMRYPDWRAVIPEAPHRDAPKVRDDVDARVLLKLQNANDEFARRRAGRAVVVLPPTNPRKGMLVVMPDLGERYSYTAIITGLSSDAKALASAYDMGNWWAPAA